MSDEVQKSGEIDVSDIDGKIIQLTNSMISVSLSDKGKAEETFSYIRELIEKTEAENAKVEEEIQKAKADGKKPDRVYKRSVTGLLEQLNRSLELSISSTEKLVKLTDICTKLKNINEKAVNKTDFTGLSVEILNEIKQQKDQARAKRLEAKRLNSDQ